MPTQTFYVGDEVSGGVRAEVVIRIAGERTAPPAASLVIQDRPIELGVEEATLAGTTTRPWSTVYEEPRQTVRIPGCLPVHVVAVTYIQHALVMRVNSREHDRHTQLLPFRESTRARTSPLRQERLSERMRLKDPTLPSMPYGVHDPFLLWSEVRLRRSPGFPTRV